VERRGAIAIVAASIQTLSTPLAFAPGRTVNPRLEFLCVPMSRIGVKIYSHIGSTQGLERRGGGKGGYVGGRSGGTTIVADSGQQQFFSFLLFVLVL
jgi:hypothetical protein